MQWLHQLNAIANLNRNPQPSLRQDNPRDISIAASAENHCGAKDRCASCQRSSLSGER
ncbi:MAG: hypothetical protein M3256_22745 [Actinomycetota bacterium]|nr:hypothetical protein [Actinomycetota bacterium]